MKAKMLRPVLPLVALSTVASAQALQWNLVSASGPAGRSDHGMVFDTLRNRCVLFGGRLASGARVSDTWEWDGTTWSQVSNIGPSPRSSMALAYDSARNRVVLFGGNDGAIRGDTWEWDGSTWIPQLLATGPGARESAAMTYDSVRQRTVLFGGQSGATFYGDTWEWNGSTWQQVGQGSAPLARTESAMVFDSMRSRAVLFGGAGPVGGAGPSPTDTWEWDGGAWSLVATVGPPGRTGHGMVFDSLRGRCVVTGGFDQSSWVSGTWEWDGTAWSMVLSGMPISSHAMAFDSYRGRTVLFGGNQNGWPSQPNTWELVSTLATGTPFGTGCGTPALTLAPVSSAPPSLNSTAQATLSSVPSPLAFVALGLSSTTYGPFSLPVTLASIGMPGCDLLQSADVVGEPATITGTTTASYDFAIPNNSGLVGLHLYLQGWVWAPGVNAANIVVSNGLDWQLGY